MKIIVYGIGKRGKELIKNVEEISENIEIVAVTDTFIQNINSTKGILVPYVEVSSINRLEYDYITITPQRYYDEIKESLLKQGIDKEKIITVNELWKIFGRKYGKLHCNLCNNAVFSWKYIGGAKRHLFT